MNNDALTKPPRSREQAALDIAVAELRYVARQTISYPLPPEGLRVLTERVEIALDRIAELLLLLRKEPT
jgi:hypothetical protein